MNQSKISLDHFLNSGGLLSLGPNEFWVAWADGDPIRASQPSRTEFSFYAPDFFLQEAFPWWIFPNVVKINRSDLINLLSELTGTRSVQLNWSAPDDSEFKEVFFDLKKRIQLGALKKAVPVVFHKAQLEFQISERAVLLRNLLLYTREVPVFVYGVWSANEGILGATPELLFRQDRQGTLETAALAGTRLKEHQQCHLPLLEDPKEMDEHQIVIEGITQSLSRFGEVNVFETREVRLPLLSHLYTPISLQVDPRQVEKDSGQFFTQVIQNLHPTPALGAFPREAGMKWLVEHQQSSNRYRFGAPFGTLFESGESTCVVGIRNIQWQNSTLLLGAGCGVVPASDVDREWREVCGKIQSVKEMFGL